MKSLLCRIRINVVFISLPILGCQSIGSRLVMSYQNKRGIYFSPNSRMSEYWKWKKPVGSFQESQIVLERRQQINPRKLVQFIYPNVSCSDPESFVKASDGVRFNSDIFFCFYLFLMRGERIQIPLKAGHHWPASKTPFKANNGPTLQSLINIPETNGMQTTYIRMPFHFFYCQNQIEPTGVLSTP